MRIDKRALFWPCAITAAAVVFLVAAWRYQFRDLREVRREIEVTRQDLAAEQDAAQSIAALEREVKALAKKTSELDAMIPPDEELDTFLQELAKFAGEHKLESDEFKPGKQVRSQEVVALPVTFKVRGSFAAVHALLRDIEQMPRLARIDGFSARVGEEGRGVIEADVSLRVFFRAS
jgi:Tfp pilus assembly protein PilO